MMGYGIMGWGWLYWIIICAVIVGLLAYVMTNRSVEGGRKNRSMEILKERFARGEIEQEEYEEKRHVLSH